MVSSRGWGTYSKRQPEWSFREVRGLIVIGDLSGQFERSGLIVICDLSGKFKRLGDLQ